MKFLKSVLRLLAYLLLTLVALLIVLAVVSIAPVDRTPMKNFPEYDQMMVRLDSIGVAPVPKAKTGFRVGYSKVNLTPPFETATAGYGKRMGKSFTGVHDSLYVRTLVIENGAARVAIVSADLLIVPPTVTDKLRLRLPDVGFSLDNTFLGAIHSHNSIGNWGEGAASFIYGDYEDRVVDFICDKILESLEIASANILPSEIAYGKIDVNEAVNNRVIDNGPEDSFLRFIDITRSDSTKLALTTFTAHATCLSSKDLRLSRDYPGKFIDLAENGGFDFVMFMAGAVGSHGCGVPEDGMNCIDNMGELLARKFLKADVERKVVTDSTLLMTRVDLLLPDPQVKIGRDWKIRSFLFNATFGEYPACLNSLQLGNILLLGTPCDYSGEFDSRLDSVAATENMNVIVTSFNGGYIGYVTPSKYYDVDHYETRLMNWYPPGTGEYLNESLTKFIRRSAP
jgi:neutral ceramidase